MKTSKMKAMKTENVPKSDKDKTGGLEGYDLNNYASVVEIDDHPEVSDDPNLLCGTDDVFQEVTSKKRRKVMIGNEVKKMKKEPLTRNKSGSCSRQSKLPPRLAKQRKNIINAASVTSAWDMNVELSAKQSNPSSSKDKSGWTGTIMSANCDSLTEDNETGKFYIMTSEDPKFSLSSEYESKRKVISSAQKRLSKFVRATYSDSGSESKFSPTDSSSSEEGESACACSTLDECTYASSSKHQKTPKPQRKITSKLKAWRIPDRVTPCKGPQNVLEESRLRLDVSAVPKSLPCRKEEYYDIYGFVRGCLCSQTGGCMYISGVPGTGKTATVREVIRNLEQEKEEGEIPLFSFVEMNGYWLTDPYQAYVHVFKSLTGKTISSLRAAKLLEKRFTEPGPKNDAVILLVDELDRLWTRKQTVMYNIFDWPSRENSKLIVLGIANAVDLPERLMMNRISSRLGLTRKTFQPYNFRQLQEIIMNRIRELNVFDSDAVQLVSRKVAAVSGDARRALRICQQAINVAERSRSSPKKKVKILVGMEHVEIAIQEALSCPVISTIKTLSEMAKMFLRCMLAEFKRLGSEETTLLKVKENMDSYCRFEGLPIPNTDIYYIAARLAHSSIILVDNFRNGCYMKIRLNASPDDVNDALTGRVV